MTIIIRRDSPKDIEQLKKLFLITRLNTFIYDPPEKFKLDDYINSVNGEEVWVAEQDTIIVGFVSMWLEDNFIHNLFVHPNWQDRGIGKRLLEKAEERLQPPMELRVRIENLKACNFYQKHGWLDVGISKDVVDPHFTYRKY